MKMGWFLWSTLWFLMLTPFLLGAESVKVLQRSDVVFMYQADRDTYEAYGATVLAWGGQPTPSSLEAARGVKFFGSVGMVTEFARYYDRFPDTYEQGLCRDVQGNPVRVPWLTDHQHRGVPYWWCCTQQPLFRQYLRERVVETVKAGADGVHIDDHLGTAGGLWLGLCFCQRCIQGFQEHLSHLPPATLEGWGIRPPASFDYGEVLRRWLAEGQNRDRKVTAHPMWEEWTVYQCRAAAAFMQSLRELAEETAEHPVPMGANAGLLWPRHLVDYKTLDLFSAETDHHAAEKRFTDLPLVAYRMADAVGRPYAATASGQDWAFIKESSLPGLVRGWIALSYAAGHCLMAPHRQWCYTPEKGTHWYAGPREKFAPLYRFVRREAGLFVGYENHADVGVVLPHAAFIKNPKPWFDLCTRLSATNLSYRLLVAGDALVDHPLLEQDWRTCPAWLVPDLENLLPTDRRFVEERLGGPQVFRNADDALKNLRPAVRLDTSVAARALPRTKPGSAVIHLLNDNYEAARDDVKPLTDLRLRLDLKALGVSNVRTGRLVGPELEPRILNVREGGVVIPELGLWALLVLEAP